jgi:hypothetical protein
VPASHKPDNRADADYALLRHNYFRARANKMSSHSQSEAESENNLVRKVASNNPKAIPRSFTRAMRISREIKIVNDFRLEIK